MNGNGRLFGTNVFWDENKLQRLAWSRQGRSRDYRFPDHFPAWNAEGPEDKPPLGYAKQ